MINKDTREHYKCECKCGKVFYAVIIFLVKNLAKITARGDGYLKAENVKKYIQR